MSASLATAYTAFMAISRRQATAKPLASNGTPSSAGLTLTTEDRKLLNWTRTNATQIVAGLSRVASDAGASNDWSIMNEYLQIANNGAALCGLATTALSSGPSPPSARVPAISV
jgi:hypothetical protein